MGEPAAKVVRRGAASQSREDLRLAGQAAKSARVQDAGAVASKGRAVGVRRLGVRAAAQLTVGADGNPRRQREGRLGLRVRHRFTSGDSLRILHSLSGYTAIGNL